MANNLPGSVNKNLFDTLFWDYIFNNASGGPFSVFDKLDGNIGTSQLTGLKAPAGLSGTLVDNTATPGFTTVAGWSGRAAFPATASVLVLNATGMTSSGICFPVLQTVDGTLTSLTVACGDVAAAAIITYATMTSGTATATIGGTVVSAAFNATNNQTVTDLATAIGADPVASTVCTASASSGVLTLTIKTTYALGALGNAVTLTAGSTNGTRVVTSTVVTGTTAANGFFQNGGNVKLTGNAGATGTTKVGFLLLNP